MFRVKVLQRFPSISSITTAVAIASTLLNSNHTSIMIMVESITFNLSFPS